MPYLSSSVVDCALTIPIRYKISPFKQKIVLREALASILPAGIISRPKAIQKIRHDLKLSAIVDVMADEYLGEKVVAERALFTMRDVDQLRRKSDNVAYSGDQLYRLWVLINIEIWCRHFIDNRGLPWGFLSESA
jgi:asparagine synthase (glutamine-hydrolysing)